MNLVSAVNGSINTGLVGFVKTTNKIATNSTAVKKTGQVVVKAIEAYNYSKGTIYLPSFVNKIKGLNDVIDLYATLKYYCYWSNPFDSKMNPKTLFTQSLEKAIRHCKVRKGGLKNNPDKLAELIVNEALSKGRYLSDVEGISVIMKDQLEKHGFSKIKAQEIVNNVKLAVKPKPFLQVLTMFLYTVADVGGCLYFFDKCKLIKLSNIANSIGTKMPALMKFSLKKALKQCLIAAHALSIFDTSYKLISAHRSSTGNREASKQKNQLLWKLAVTSLDLLDTAVPLMITANPPLFIGLSILAKGTGLLSILYRD